MNKSPSNCSPGKNPCRRHGALQLQLLGTNIVPSVIQADNIEPQYQAAWKSAVIRPRCFGCAISVVKGGAAVCEKPRPIPIMIRVPRIAQGPFVAAWMIDATSMMVDPIATVYRRPIRSET